MFKFNQPAAHPGLDEVIDQALNALKGHEEDTKEYAQVVDQLTKLYAIKQEDKPDRVHKDTLAIIAGNIAGILMIVGYEKFHVVTSKALPFVGKFK